MLKPESLLAYLKNPGKAVLSLAEKGYLNRMGDRSYLKLLFRTYTGYSLDLDHPKTFNEKLQWLKLNDRREEYKIYVDKIRSETIYCRINRGGACNSDPGSVGCG